MGCSGCQGKPYRPLWKATYTTETEAPHCYHQHQEVKGKVLVSAEKGTHFLWKPLIYLSESIFILLNDVVNGMAQRLQNSGSEANSKMCIQEIERIISKNMLSALLFQPLCSKGNQGASKYFRKSKSNIESHI
jgi:hypothetical protein